jgi:probable O-glycosylation ligase (exosortase A-associated)
MPLEVEVEQSKARSNSELPSGRLASSHPRWDLAFLGIVAFLIIDYTRLPYRSPFLMALHISKIAGGLAIFGLLLSRRVRGESALLKSIDFPLIFFSFATIVSACFADYQSAAWAQVADSLKWILVYYLVSRIVNNPWRLKVFAIFYLLLNLKLAIFVIRMYLYYGAEFMGHEMVAMVGAGTSDFFGNSNDLGTAMCVALPVAVALFFGERKRLSQMVYLASFFGIFAAMLLSGCRGAFLGTLAVITAAFLRSERKKIALVMGVIVVLGTFVVLPSGNLERLVSALHWQEDATASVRIRFWKAGMHMLQDHPLTGVGPGNFAPNYLDHYHGDDPFPRAWYPHSIYLQAFAELGLVGGLPALAVWIFALRMNRSTRARMKSAFGSKNGHFEYRMALGLELALIGFLVSGAFLTVLYYPHLWYLLGMTGGLRVACFGHDNKFEIAGMNSLTLEVPQTEVLDLPNSDSSNRGESGSGNLN